MVDRVLVSRHMVNTVILLTAPPPGRCAPGPAACSNFHRYSPAPPATDTPPSPGYRYRTGRSSSSSGQTSLGRAPRGAVEPLLPPRRSCKRSRITLRKSHRLPRFRFNLLTTLLQPDREPRRPLPVAAGIELEEELVPADGLLRGGVGHGRVHHGDRRALLQEVRVDRPLRHTPAGSVVPGDTTAQSPPGASGW